MCFFPPFFSSVHREPKNKPYDLNIIDKATLSVLKIYCLMPPGLLFLKAGCWAVDIWILGLNQVYLCQASVTSNLLFLGFSTWTELQLY